MGKRIQCNLINLIGITVIAMETTYPKIDRTIFRQLSHRQIRTKNKEIMIESREDIGWMRAKLINRTQYEAFWFSRFLLRIFNFFHPYLPNLPLRLNPRIWRNWWCHNDCLIFRYRLKRQYISQRTNLRNPLPIKFNHKSQSTSHGVDL